MCVQELAQTIHKINKHTSLELKLKKTIYIKEVCTEEQQCSRYYRKTAAK